MVAGLVLTFHNGKEIQSHGVIHFRCNLQGYVPVGKERWEDQMIAILHFIYTSGTIGKIHAVLYKLEKDGDTYISPEKKLLSELNNKEIKGPTLLSHKADPGRD